MMDLRDLVNNIRTEKPAAFTALARKLVRCQHRHHAVGVSTGGVTPELYLHPEPKTLNPNP